MRRINGVFYAMLSAAAFGVMPILAKIAYKGGVNAVTVLAFRFLFAAIMIFPLMIVKKISFEINKKELRDVFIVGGGSYAVGCLTLFLAYNYMSVGLATTMHFIYPIVVTIISVIFFKEKLKKPKIFALILSCIGIYLLVGGGKENLAPVGVFFAIISGIFYSFYIISAGHSSIGKMDVFCATFYLSIASSSILFISAICTGSLVTAIKAQSIVAILGISFISTVIALMAFLKGVKIIGASNAAVLSTLEPIVSLILGVIILKEKLTPIIIFGSILILISVVIITLGEK